MRKYCSYASLACCFLLVSCLNAFASPVNGDYRSSPLSSVTVSLSSASNWEQYNGTTKTWVVALTAPVTVVASGNTITINSGDTWTNSAAVTLPSGVTLIHEGSNGSFSTSNKITCNGTYVHKTSASVQTILSGMILGSTSTINYEGSAGALAGNTFVNLSINSAGAYELSSSDNTFSVSGTLTIGSSVVLTVPAGLVATLGSIVTGSSSSVTVEGTLTMGTGQVTGAGNITVNGTLKTAHASGLGGTFANTGSKTLGASSTIEYNGTTQAIDGRNDFANIVVSGGGAKSLEGNCAASGNVTLNSSILDLGFYNLVLTGDVSGGSASAYIKTSSTGYLQLNNITASPRVFPVGRSTYNPITISNGSNLSWRVNLIDATSLTSVLSPKQINRTWDITPVGTPSGATVVFQYNDGDTLQKGASFSTSSKVKVMNHHGSEWITAVTGATPLGTAGGIRTVTVTGWSSFSPFVITNSEEVLPVRFRNVKATPRGEKVQVEFTNETESDVLAYHLERSSDGSSFSALAILKPAKNNGGTAIYTYSDGGPLPGQTIYRIKALQVTGQAEYSTMVRVKGALKEVHLRIVPNPVTSQKLMLQAEGIAGEPYNALIINVAGQVIKQFNFQQMGPVLRKEIDISGLPKGAYILKLFNTILLAEQQFVVQ